ncbi:hypothetical protein [Exiguobacterium undae]|uniref:DUF1449 family protein n=1 Tax=Exiguobacterium undae TaxID=169177 RepID=A0ABX2V4Z7_9BACL|nr:hypothetical protein [Exiguobacterium undae]OAN10138.1 hypothetical protein A3783_15355 [Exiguobacterium undae]
MKIPSIIALIISLSAGIIPGISLVSKTKFESTFLTTEQILKRHFFIVFVAALYLSFLLSFFYVLVSYFIRDLSYESINWSTVIIIAVSTFLLSFVFSICYAKPISNFIIKEKSVYKVRLENLGELYIIKMLDHETCICSYDPNANLNSPGTQIYLVKVDDLIKLPLSKEIITLPSRSFYKKLFD